LKKIFASVVAVVLVAGCAGREPVVQPIAMTNDDKKDCDSIESEVFANAANARAKISANQSRDGGDVAIGVAGVLLFWPALFAMDVKNADGVEGNALVDRNDHLRRIALNKGCDVSTYPVVVKYQ